MNKVDEKIDQMKADIFKALGHPLRLGIVKELGNGRKCVCKLAELVNSERSNVSRHLSVMVHAGILRSEKQGLMVYYELAAPCVPGFLDCLENMLEKRLADQHELLKAMKA